MEVTERGFWEKYWGEISLPKKVNVNFKNDKVIAQTILKYISKTIKKKTALEIGCAPGKWMLFLYENLNYNIHGFEYLPIAANKTRENLLMCNVPEKNFEVITADFLAQTPTPKYDLVTSFGFIEHFEDYYDIFQRHISYTKEGGYVIIGFPNFRGINYFMQRFIDKISGSQIIENHNISMMDKDKMEKMIADFDKKVIYISYIGGFESALFNVNDISNKLLRILIKVVVKSLSVIFQKNNNKFISSYLIFVVKND